MEQRIPTYIVDSDNLLCEGLKRLLDETPFAPRCSGESFDEVVLQPDGAPILFIIFARHDGSLRESIRKIKARIHNSRIVVLADEAQGEQLSSALSAGANAALLTSISPVGLIKSLHAVMSDDIVVAASKLWQGNTQTHVASGNLNADQSNISARVRQLSSREIAILKQISFGDSNKHIARYFDIAEATVKSHVKTILRKVGAANRTQAAMWAVNHHFEAEGETNCVESLGIDAEAAADCAIVKDRERDKQTIRGEDVRPLQNAHAGPRHAVSNRPILFYKS